MASLIARLRRLVNDPNKDTWTDDELQDFLDTHRWDVHRARLEPVETFDAGTVKHLDYYADVGNWEEDATLEDSDGTDLSPATSDYVVGHWTFTSNTDPPVYITGKYYDLYAAAVDVLEAWAAKMAMEYDVAVGDQRFSRSQKARVLMALADKYRQHVMAQSVQVNRSDTELPTGSFVIAK